MPGAPLVLRYGPGVFGRAPVAAGLVVLSAIPSRLSPESVPIDKSPVDLEAEAAKAAAHTRAESRGSPRTRAAWGERQTLRWRKQSRANPSLTSKFPC